MAERADHKCVSCHTPVRMEEPLLLLVDCFVYCKECDNDEIIEETRPVTGRLDRELITVETYS